jgi:hypothetical protein
MYYIRMNEEEQKALLEQDVSDFVSIVEKAGGCMNYPSFFKQAMAVIGGNEDDVKPGLREASDRGLLIFNRAWQIVTPEYELRRAQS